MRCNTRTLDRILRKILSRALKDTAKNTQRTAKLDASQTPIVIASPHQNQAGDGATSRKEAIGSRDCWCGYSIIAWFTILREIEELIPARLSDGASYD